MGSCCASVLSYQQHFASCLLLDIFSNLDSSFVNELAVGYVNSFPLFTKVGGNILYLLNDIILKIGRVFFCSCL